MNHHPQVQEQLRAAILAEAGRLGHHLTPFYPELNGPDQLAMCSQCGGRITVNGHLHALEFACDGNKLRALESGAWLTGGTASLLLERFERELKELPPDVARFFDPGEFDPPNRMLRSNDGVWNLSWLLREDPHLPIDEDNPQTPGGLVDLQRMVSEEGFFAARYIGPLFNPNPFEDETLWDVLPLEPGTLGLAYECEGIDGKFYWHFRRLEGITGYCVSYEDFDFKLSPKEFLAAQKALIPTPPGTYLCDPDSRAQGRAEAEEALEAQAALLDDY